jgi:hypothetical protein
MSDFFISYTNVDRPWAEWVDQVVREAGISTVIQARDFAPGDSFVEKMDEATRECDRTLAVLSPEYLASHFAMMELRAA